MTAGCRTSRNCGAIIRSTRAHSIFNTSLSNPAQGTVRLFPIGLFNFNSPWEIPYMMKWSFGVQRQLPAEVLLEVSYVGSRGVAWVITRDINATAAECGRCRRPGEPERRTAVSGLAAITTDETSGNSVYHSLQTLPHAALCEQLLVTGVVYVLPLIDNRVTPVNSQEDSRLERAPSTFDRTHIFVGSYVYQLPFGQNLRGVARKALHGWQVSAITSFQSGLPLTITVTGDRAGTGPGTRPNLVAPVVRVQTLARWFNTEAFANPALGTFGNAGRSLVRGPGITIGISRLASGSRSAKK